MGLKDRLTPDAAALPVDDASRDRDGDVQGDPVIAMLRRRLLEEIDLAEISGLTPTQRRARLERLVGHLVSREGPVLPTADRSALIRQIVDAALGLGVIEGFLADPNVTEIMVNGPGDIWVEREGRLERVEGRFEDEAQLYQTIDRVVQQVNRRVDESSPMVDARLPGGERVNVIIPPVSLNGPVITIRRFPRSYSVSELVELGSLEESLAQLLRAFVHARFNIIVSGGTATGKTTLLNALSGFIPVGERVVTIEDSAELQLRQPHVVRLESRPANVEGKGEITIRDLVRNSLRMRPDRIIVGEVRGGETLDMLQAMNTGHEGSIATVHANSTEDAIVRLETLAGMTDVKILVEAVRDQINSAIDVIVQLARGPDGSRRVVEVAAVASRRREAFRLATVSRFEAEPLGPDLIVRGEWRHFRLPPEMENRLRLAGDKLPAPFTAAEAAAPEREAE
jgi:pilus assembly protein CpaF